MTPPYSVTLWGSHPTADNDDCWTGVDFPSRDAAEVAFADPWSVDEDWWQRELHDRDSVWIELAGPDVERFRRLRPDCKRPGDDDWRREMAMEAGMLHGVDAYNETMGYE